MHCHGTGTCDHDAFCDVNGDDNDRDRGDHEIGHDCVDYGRARGGGGSYHGDAHVYNHYQLQNDSWSHYHHYHYQTHHHAYSSQHEPMRY